MAMRLAAVAVLLAGIVTTAQAEPLKIRIGWIVTPAERTPVYDNRKLVVAADLDGYILELVE